MPRRQVITDEVKRLIAKVHREHPTMPAKYVQKEVITRLQQRDPHKPPDWPGLSAVQKILHELGSKHIPTPLDDPWSLYTLAEFDVPADALQAVLDAYAVTVAWDLRPLTVREAKWVARLYRVMTDIEELTIAARACAENEGINEMTGKPSRGLVDADFETRAVTGKPGIAYKCLGDGKFQMRILDSSILED